MSAVTESSTLYLGNSTSSIFHAVHEVQAGLIDDNVFSFLKGKISAVLKYTANKSLISPIFLRALAELTRCNVHDISQNKEPEFNGLHNLGADCSLFVACIVCNGSLDPPEQRARDVDAFWKWISGAIPETAPVVS